MNQTSLANTVEATNEKMRCDASVKRVLADKYILAWILKYVAPEFQKYDIKTIKNCIEATPEVASVPVWSGLTNSPMITGMTTENAIPNEGKITFDILFYALTPEKHQIKIIVNVEAQNDYYPGYDLMSVVKICLDDEINSDESPELIKMLTVLLADNINFEKKKTLLEEFDIPMTEKIRKELASMCNYSDGVERKGIQKGIQQGIQKGIVALVESLKELEQSNEVIMNKLMEKFGLSEQEAQTYL